MISEETLGDISLKTIYKITYRIEGSAWPQVRYYTAGELTILGHSEFIPSEFEIETIPMKEYFERIFGGSHD